MLYMLKKEKENDNFTSLDCWKFSKITKVKMLQEIFVNPQNCPHLTNNTKRSIIAACPFWIFHIQETRNNGWKIWKYKSTWQKCDLDESQVIHQAKNISLCLFCLVNIKRKLLLLLFEDRSGSKFAVCSFEELFARGEYGGFIWWDNGLIAK